MCMKRVRRPGHVRGKWRRARPYKEWAQDHLTINLSPPDYNKRHNGNKDINYSHPQSTWLPITRKCFITEMPNEVLLQITEYLVPSGTSFHMYPSTALAKGVALVQVVHRFVEYCPDSKENEPAITTLRHRSGLHLTALARTCRVLSEMYYTVMYGKNHYVFELSAHAVHPLITGPSEGPPVESWMRHFRCKAGALWPLSVRSAKYVREVTILGTVHWDLEKSTRAKLTNQLQRTLQLMDSACSLSSLTVDIRCIPDPRVSYKRPAPQEQARRRLGWNVTATHGAMLGLNDIITSSEGCSSTRDLWDMFKGLRSIPRVVLSGDINPDFAEELGILMRSARVSTGVPRQRNREGLRPTSSFQYQNGARTGRSKCTTKK